MGEAQLLDLEGDLSGLPSDGGRGGIRTHGTLAGTPVFKTGALNHSATLPQQATSITLRKEYQERVGRLGTGPNARCESADPQRRHSGGGPVAPRSAIWPWAA